MEKYSILLGFYEKQMKLIDRIYDEIVDVDLSVYEKRYLFAMKTQQFYTALEDLFKQIAKAFENNIENLGSYHKELLTRMNTEVPKIRPAVLNEESLLLLDKIRAFRHFIRHAYGCELEEVELARLQERLRDQFSVVRENLTTFERYIKQLAS